MSGHKSKKVKSKISKLIEKSDSESDNGEHELSYYVNDRVKLMKEVLKIIKPKKIKSMAPDCIKDLDAEEINSMLLEELLGISNKRLKYIFNGQNPAGDSSSTDPEEEKPIDIISLDDVSEDDFIIDLDSDSAGKLKQKGATKRKKVKKEKADKPKTPEPLKEDNLMSVLELLELQARARAIRSQLMLEANKKAAQETETIVRGDQKSDSDEDAVIIQIPKNEEIVIDSTDSEPENKEINAESSSVPTKKKIVLIRDKIVITSSQTGKSIENITTTTEKIPENPVTSEKELEPQNTLESREEGECNNDDDEIILIVDHEEMAGMIGE